ncbi:MAG: hypothetical protein A3K03_00950 [Bdellovibrionales bacterium RIFOXYD1_FULL_44_7]|nr:MAG: hypothetical protein A3K03_00950 [Bdellovibrionales bacterium RIFOXYD1_FULL_44_7]
MKLRPNSKIVLFLSFLLIIVQVGCASAPTQRTLSKKEKARLLVEAANGALFEGDAIGALQLLKSAEAQDDSLPELYHSRALAFYSKRDIQEAIKASEIAVKLKPDYADANNTLGKLLMDDGQYKKAEAPLLVAANDPLYREAFKANTNIGILYYRQNQFGKAVKHLTKAIEEAPANSCISHYYRGHIYLRAGDLKSAINDYDKATHKFCSTFGEAHYALGIAYERNKQYDLARKKYVDVKQNFSNTNFAEKAMERLKYLP